MFISSNALLHTQLGLEARVGIELCFLDRTKLKYHISLRIQQEFGLNQHYCLTNSAWEAVGLVTDCG